MTSCPPLHPARPAAARGFTLIELMITVAIIGILAAVAYPAYTGSVLKGRRAEGRAALLQLLQQQERYLTQTGSYMTFAAGATGANGTVHPSTSGQSIPFVTRSGNGNGAYQLAASVCPAASGTFGRNECVLLTASPLSADPQAGSLSLSSTGARSCDGSKPSVCWK